MEMSDREPSTRASLLLRLRDLTDTESWTAFVECYAPRVYAWCRGLGLQESDAADATQTVLVKLIGAMRRFDYDPSAGQFRGWLRTVAHNVARDLQRDWKTRGRGTGDTQAALRIAELAGDGAWESLAETIESTHREELLRIAGERVRVRVKSHTWQAYERTAVDGISATAVAAELAMPVSEVYVSKSRVLRMLREEIQVLDRDLEST